MSDDVSETVKRTILETMLAENERARLDLALARDPETGPERLARLPHTMRATVLDVEMPGTGGKRPIQDVITAACLGNPSLNPWALDIILRRPVVALGRRPQVTAPAIDALLGNEALGLWGLIDPAWPGQLCHESRMVLTGHARVLRPLGEVLVLDAIGYPYEPDKRPVPQRTTYTEALVRRLDLVEAFELTARVRIAMAR